MLPSRSRPPRQPPVEGRGWTSLLLSRWKQVGLGLLIGVVALSLALWGVDLAEVGQAFAAADLPWLIPVALIFVVQEGVRAWRQAILVRAVVPTHTFRSSLSIFCVSTLLINALPARIGEVSRPLLLLERDDVPLGAGVAMVFVERAFDLCAMFAMIAGVAWLVPVASQELVVGGTAIDWVDLGRRTASIAVPVVLVLLVVILVGGAPVLARLRRLRQRLGPRLGRPLDLALRLGDGFVAGVSALRSPTRLAGVAALTFVAWFLTGWSFAFLARAFGIGSIIGFGEGIGVLAITMLGMIVPSAPGFVGTYEAFCRGGLALFGVAGSTGAGPSLDAVAVAYALTMHWYIFGVQAILSLGFLMVDRIDLRRLGASLAREALATEGE